MLSLLQKRRSIRMFQDQPVETEKFDILIEALLRSPSSRGLNPWEFVAVTDPQLLEELSQAKAHGAAFLAGAPLAIVICADTTRSDVWVEDCSIAAIILQLTAESLGLGSCWAQIRNRTHSDGRSSEACLREALALPDHFGIDSIIGIGYPAEEKPAHSREELQYEKIHLNRFVQKLST